MHTKCLGIMHSNKNSSQKLNGLKELDSAQHKILINTFDTNMRDFCKRYNSPLWRAKNS